MGSSSPALLNIICPLMKPETDYISDLLQGLTEEHKNSVRRVVSPLGPLKSNISCHNPSSCLLSLHNSLSIRKNFS